MRQPLLSPTNHLLELARSGQRLPHIILAPILAIVFVLIAQFTGGVAAVLLIVMLSVIFQGIPLDAPPQELVYPDTAPEQAILLIFSFGPLFLVIWGWLALFEKRPFWTIGLERSGMWQKYLRGVGVGLLMFSASIGISAALGYIAVEDSAASSSEVGVMALGGVLLVFAGWMVQGAAEEALTRGWLFPVIGARYTPLLGLIVSSLLFAALHGFNFVGLDISSGHIALALLNLFLFGAFAVLYALYEGGMWGIFGIHAVWNWAQGNIFGFEVSGGPAPGGTIFNLMEVGPDVITGGPFGPEGGLSVTVVLLISCAVVWWLSQRPKDKPQNDSIY